MTPPQFILTGVFLVVMIVPSFGSEPTARSRPAALPAPATNQVDFDRDIGPVLERSCLRCHGLERPKAHFSLATRELSLRGGKKGPDIIPGDSAHSPLIQYVAGLVADMVMPPPDEGEPVGSNEVAMLRAWIDQGAPWGAGSGETTISATAAALIGGVAVRGDARQFREQYGRSDGWNGGLDHFTATDRLANGMGLTIDGRFLKDDYQLHLGVQKSDLGFARFGWVQYRRYYDDSGGYFPNLIPTVLRLDQDLYVDSGRAWTELGLTIPDWPSVVIGYEYQYRQGNEATLHWGPIGKGLEQRNLFPAARFLDERVHILKFDVDYDLFGTRLQDSFRGTFYSLGTQRQDDRDFLLGNSAPSRVDLVREGYSYFQGANSLRMDRCFAEWLLGSAGYLYSKLDADAAFSLDPVFPLGTPDFAESWHSQGIVLDRQTHCFNASVLVGPWEGAALSAGVFSEWARQEGVGTGNKDLLSPPGTVFLNNPVAFDSNYDQHTVEESLALRYTSVPFTALFAEARLRQQSTGEFEEEPGGAEPFLRKTDAANDLRDVRLGFNTSPWQPFTFTGQVRRYQSNTEYNHVRDESIPGISYPAFIRSRRTATDEAQAKLAYRPARFLQTSLSYRYEQTHYDSETEPVNIPFFGEISPGGSLQSGAYLAQTYSANVNWLPSSRFTLGATFSYQKTGMAAFSNQDPSVVPYRGDVCTLLVNATYVINSRSDVAFGYSFSRADYAQHNFAQGLPLGIFYTRNVISAALGHRFRKNLTGRFQYGFYQYEEPSSGGANNYTAHALFATLVWTLR